MLRSSRDHLDEVHESYFEHLRHALLISARLLKAGLACMVHAFVPGLFTRTASRCIADIQESSQERATLREARAGPSLTEMVLGGGPPPASEPAIVGFEDRVAA